MTPGQSGKPFSTRTLKVTLDLTSGQPLVLDSLVSHSFTGQRTGLALTTKSSTSYHKVLGRISSLPIFLWARELLGVFLLPLLLPDWLLFSSGLAETHPGHLQIDSCPLACLSHCVQVWHAWLGTWGASRLLACLLRINWCLCNGPYLETMPLHHTLTYAS